MMVNNALVLFPHLKGFKVRPKQSHLTMHKWSKYPFSSLSIPKIRSNITIQSQVSTHAHTNKMRSNVTIQWAHTHTHLALWYAKFNRITFVRFIPGPHIPKNTWHQNRRLFVIYTQKMLDSLHSLGLPQKVKFISNLKQHVDIMES